MTLQNFKFIEVDQSVLVFFPEYTEWQIRMTSKDLIT